MLGVDAKNWFLDAIMSFAVAAAFLVTNVLEESHPTLVSYVDPAVVCILCVISLPVPVTIILDNSAQLVGRAPKHGMQRAMAVVLRTPQLQALEAMVRVLAVGETTLIWHANELGRSWMMFNRLANTYVQEYMRMRMHAATHGRVSCI